MNQEQLKDKIKDFKERFAIGGWLNENINMVFVEAWLIKNFLTKESPKKSPVKIETPKVETPTTGPTGPNKETTEDNKEVKQEVSEEETFKESEDTLPVE